MNSSFQVGDTLADAVSITDASGAPGDASTATCLVTLPDGTTAAATVTHGATGSYTATLLSTQAGRYVFVWTVAGGVVSTKTFSSQADVWPTDPRFLLSLARARDELDLSAGNTVHDDKIRFFLAAVTPVIEDIAGLILSTSVTRTADGGQNAILLPDTPTSIVSLSEKGTVLVEDTDFTVDYDAGILYRQYSSGRSRLFGSAWETCVQRGVITVTYMAGSTVTPPNVILAAAEELRFLYSIGQQGARPAWGQDNADVVFTPSGYAVPRRVVELLAPQMSDMYLGIY